MQLVLLVIHIFICVSLIGIILLQKSGTDGLSGLQSGSNMNLFSGRTSANILTKTTTILAVLFMVNSLLLGNLAAKKYEEKSIADKIVDTEQTEGKEKEVTKPVVPMAE
jgi:preprotein translocase subunit SecG